MEYKSDNNMEIVPTFQKIYKKLNKSEKLKKLEKQLRREQRCIARKYEYLKKGESTNSRDSENQTVSDCGVYKNL